MGSLANIHSGLTWDWVDTVTSLLTTAFTWLLLLLVSFVTSQPLVASLAQCNANGGKPVVGHGKEVLERWYYSPISAKCLKFMYSGDGGSDNNFLTHEECRDTCIKAQQEREQDESFSPTRCSAPTDDMKAEKDDTDFCIKVYYDPNAQRCVRFNSLKCGETDFFMSMVTCFQSCMVTDSRRRRRR